MKKLITPKKIKNLAAKALKDKPQWKPSKGKIYLKDLEIGEMFSIGKTTGILFSRPPLGAYNASGNWFAPPGINLHFQLSGAEGSHATSEFSNV